MKRQLSILSLVILASAAIAAPSQTMKPAVVPKAIKARYTSLLTTLRKVDFKGFSDFFASDFVSVDPQGKSTSKDEFLNGIKPMFDAATKATAVEKTTDSKSHDGLVDVTFDFTLKFKGKGGTTVIHEVGVDSWKQIGDNWLLVKTVDSKFDMTMPKPKVKKGKG